LTGAASNRPCYFHATISQMVFSKTDMFLKSPPVIPSPTPKRSSPATMTLSPATVRSLALEPGHAVSDRVPPTIMEATHRIREEPIKFSSYSSSRSVSSSSQLTGKYSARRQQIGFGGHLVLTYNMKNDNCIYMYSKKIKNKGALCYKADESADESKK
jgi:hypothetical protein